MTAIRLSERQAAALTALAKATGPVTGPDLAWLMSDAGRETSGPSAHQAGAALAREGLAARLLSDRVRWEITDAGRKLLARLTPEVTP